MMTDLQYLNIYLNVDKLDNLTDANWDYISSNIILSNKFIDTFNKYLNWDYISQYQNLSKFIIEKYYNRINWERFSLNMSLSKEVIEKYSDKIDYDFKKGFIEYLHSRATHVNKLLYGI